MAYVAEAVSLSIMYSHMKALALIVVVTFTMMGPEYAVDQAEGSEPSMV